MHRFVSQDCHSRMFPAENMKAITHGLRYLKKAIRDNAPLCDEISLESPIVKERQTPWRTGQSLPLADKYFGYHEACLHFHNSSMSRMNYLLHSEKNMSGFQHSGWIYYSTRSICDRYSFKPCIVDIIFGSTRESNILVWVFVIPFTRRTTK